ncbi:dihydrofolate reductase family protein [Solirubrobacter ginsenosidimutans]|uniref:Dihydrofolate reductase family protein n=1 Tax=Solirubrobacter ginsenosidimutans TaxID=490573 RepID=A0A9X3MWY8_9ACTN|nr:dihydrofolate reductase family protein [Solirubrobacter ginsenosidimutans]MDA0162873.1 dihydrofolate reductase family protein [Solirubrobacter ginsenosidimutans]
MGHVTVVQFISLDGVIEDPDGRDGTAFGGWAFRYGPETVAGDKFRLGEALETSSLLFGRATWERFARLWPARDDAFADVMNRIPKLVASRSPVDVSRWSNSAQLSGGVTEVDGDVIVVGSASIAGQLIEHDLVDEYRLLVFPLVIGEGRRLFERGPVSLELVACERAGEAAMLTYRRRATPLR